jgi:integrase
MNRTCPSLAFHVERLGHADVALTLNVYSHVLPGMQEEAARRIDELLA